MSRADILRGAAGVLRDEGSSPVTPTVIALAAWLDAEADGYEMVRAAALAALDEGGPGTSVRVEVDTSSLAEAFARLLLGMPPAEAEATEPEDVPAAGAA